MFDALPETKRKGAILGRRSVSTAVLAHAALLLTVVSTSVLARVDPGEDPPMPWDTTIIVVSETARLGDNPNAGGRTHELKKESRPPQVPTEPSQPTKLPDENPTVVAQMTAPPEVAPTKTSGPGGFEGPETGKGPASGPGDEDGTYGVPWGKPDGDGTGPPVPEGEPSDQPPIVITVGVEPPVLLVRVEPEYPEMARIVRIQGVVILEAVVGTDGRVEALRTLKSVSLLDDAAKKAVRQWVYKPAKHNGRTVKVYVTVRVEFQLH